MAAQARGNIVNCSIAMVSGILCGLKFQAGHCHVRHAGHEIPRKWRNW